MEDQNESGSTVGENDPETDDSPDDLYSQDKNHESSQTEELVNSQILEQKRSSELNHQKPRLINGVQSFKNEHSMISKETYTPNKTAPKNMNSNISLKRNVLNWAKNAFSNYLAFIALAIILMLIIHSNNYSSSTSPVDQQKEIQIRKEKIAELSKILVELKLIYKNQTDLFWANIESSFKYSVVHSKGPSVVLIVNDKETKQLTQRLIIDIVQRLQSRVIKRTGPLSNLIIDPINDSTLKKFIYAKENDKAKLHVDTRLDELFKSEEKLALVKNIELIPVTTMILFYVWRLRKCQVQGGFNIHESESGRDD